MFILQKKSGKSILPACEIPETVRLQGWLNRAYSNANLSPVMTIPARSRKKA